ncbi:MAG: hypothetical protein M1813_007745 [Trichoglossum hirsutum]|nr:MAG: hypothetical protein M1813_007745 [Trichoglossum hirsutum]
MDEYHRSSLNRKSQIAIEYSYRLAENFPDYWIFWVYSSSEERFNKSYQEIANKSRLPGRENPKAEIINRLVSEWLKSELSGRWLMILDNADNADVFFRRTSGSSPEKKETLFSYIPQATNGLILITSRDREAAFRLTGDGGGLIYVNKMPKGDSMALLRTKLQGDQSDDEVGDLVEALEYLPLAIVQVSAYIVVRSPRMTISKYLDLFRQSESNQESLLNKDFSVLRKDPSVPNSVITTWEISFRQIQSDEPHAAELLFFMSFLDRQGIPEPLLRKCIVDDMEFEEALGRLCAFSFITTEKGDESYEIHRLVQLASRRWLGIIGESDRWSAEALSKLSEVFPYGYFQNWETCTTYLPHASAVLQNKQGALQNLVLRGELLGNVASYLLSHGLYGAAEEMFLQRLEIMEQEFGKEHEHTLIAMSDLALAYLNQGRLEQAKALEVKHLEMCKRHEQPCINLLTSGPIRAGGGAPGSGVRGLREGARKEHPRTLTNMSNLASTYSHQGRFEQAEALQVQVLELRSRVLGKEHPDTLVSMENLASTYSGQRRFERAEALQVQVVELCSRALGKEHPRTLTSMSNLALTYLCQGQLEQLDALQVQLMELCSRLLGKEHRNPLASMGNLAITYSHQGRFE